MTDEFASLDAVTKAAVESVIAECRQAGKMVRRPHGEKSEVYAYPQKDGISWGVDGPPNGWQIARGMRR